MKKNGTKRSKTWLAWALAGLWVVFAGWHQLFRPEPPAVYSGFSQSLAFDDPCRSASSFSKPSFSQRYACASNRRLGEDRAAFVSGLEKLLVIFGPPAVVFIYFRRRKTRGGAGSLRKSTS